MDAPGAYGPGQIGPAADEVRRRLLGMIERGSLQPGQKLESERELAISTGVSRSTLRQALAALEESGAIRRVPGRGGGTFIAAAKVERDLSRIVGVPMLLRDQGFTAGSRVVRVGVSTAGADAASALGLAPSDFVIDLVSSSPGCRSANLADRSTSCSIRSMACVRTRPPSTSRSYRHRRTRPRSCQSTPVLHCSRSRERPGMHAVWHSNTPMTCFALIARASA